MRNEMFYLIECDYVGPIPSQMAHRAQKIAVQIRPGRENISGKECEKGWLGSTNDWNEHAIGAYNETEARSKLKEYGIKIPDSSKLECTRYCHSHKDAEWYNEKFCY